jgi:hypothetical protein
MDASVRVTSPSVSGARIAGGDLHMARNVYSRVTLPFMTETHYKQRKQQRLKFNGQVACDSIAQRHQARTDLNIVCDT